MLAMAPTDLLGPVFLHHSPTRVFRNARVRGKDISSACLLNPMPKKLSGKGRNFDWATGILFLSFVRPLFIPSQRTACGFIFAI